MSHFVDIIIYVYSSFYVCISVVITGCCLCSVWKKVLFMCSILWGGNEIYGWRHQHERKTYFNFNLQYLIIHKRCGLHTDLFLLHSAFKLYVPQGGRKNNRKEFLWYHTDVQVVILFINMILFVDMIPSHKYFLFLFVVSSTTRRYGVWIFYNEVHVWNNHAFSKKS